MGAKLIIDFVEDLTPDDERAKLKSSHKQPLQTREKGQGRPTKKERRIMDEIREKY
jgi:ribosome-associated heat shock protein Hsp15